MAAKSAAGFPEWIQEAKNSISKSKEWQAFITEIHNALDQNLKENQIASFTEAEWIAFLEQTSKAIKDGDTYSKLNKTINQTLESHACSEVGRHIMDEKPPNTKGEVFLKCVQSASYAMLLQRPEMKNKFKACFNQILNHPTRQLMWRLFLENSKLRKQYADLLKRSPRLAISPQDRAISQKCDHLLKSEPTFAAMKGSIGIFYGMKALLSFHHTRKNTKVPLPDEDYFLAIPFVFLASPAMERTKPATVEVVALLVEEFFTFLDKRPKYLLAGQEDEDSFKTFVLQIAELLHEKDKDIESFFIQIYNTKEKIVATEVGKRAVVASGLESLLKPVLLSMFVGYLNLGCLLFVWDQFVMGWLSPVVQQKIMAALSASLLMLCKKALLNCKMTEEVDACLKEEGSKLTAQQFQNMIKQHFYTELFNLLNIEDVSLLPVVDESQGDVTPWKIKERKEQAKTSEEDELKYREEIERLKEENEKAKQKQDEIRKELEDIIEQERKARLQVERTAEREIESLQRELDNLRGRAAPTSDEQFQSQDSLASGILPPMGTPASHITTPVVTPKAPTTRSSQRSSQQNKDREKAVQIGADLLRKISSAFSKVAHEEGRGLAQW